MVLRAGENRRQHRNDEGCASQGMLTDISAYTFHPIHKTRLALSQWAETLTSTTWHNSLDEKSYFLKVCSVSVRVSLLEHQCIKNSSSNRFFRLIDQHLKYLSASVTLNLSHGTA